MATRNICRLVIAVALCSAFPSIAPAQRLDAGRSGFSPTSSSSADGHRASAAAVAALEGGARPDLPRHALYGAVAGAVLWAAYFALPAETDAPRGERLVVLPAAVLTGAAVGAVVGLLRRAL